MKQPVRLALSVVILLAALAIIQFRSVGEAVQERRQLNTFPTVIGGWTGQEDTLFTPDILSMLKMSDYLMRRYVDDTGNPTWLYIAYWQSRRKGADVHSPKNCLPGGGWEPVEATRITIPVAGAAAPITVNRYLVQKDNQMQVVMYWFQAQGKVMAGELEAKIEMVRSAMLTRRTDGAIVRVSSPVSGSVQATTERLSRYVQVIYPALAGYLPN